MKKTLLILVVLFIGTILFASVQIGTDMDCLFVQDFLISKTSVQPTLGFRIPIADSYEIRLPISLSISQSSVFMDTGLYAVCYPYKGLFFGLSMIQIGLNLKSNQNTTKTVALNEIMAGWTFKLKNGMYIEPQIVLRDPSNTYQEEYENLRGLFPCYSTVRVRCLVGYNFKIGGENEKKDN